MEIYKLFIRVNTEYCVSVWNGALTKADSNRIERIQRISARIILGSQFTSYEESLLSLDLEILVSRCATICRKFAVSCTQDPSKGSIPHRDTIFRVNANK